MCDSKDKTIWNTRNMDAKKALNYCGNHCMGGVQCTSDCIRNKEGFSIKCSDCFGNFSGCTVSNCVWKCALNSLSHSCINCVKRYCVKSFLKCSGLSSPFAANIIA